MGSPCPADEWTLCLFATFLAGSLQHSYLSGVRALHIEQGFADPLHNCLRLQRVIRGIKRTQGSPSSSCLPITDNLMLVIRKSLNLQLPVQDIAVDSSTAPSCIRVTIKASKTDPFRKGCSIHIGLGKYPLSAVHALLAY